MKNSSLYKGIIFGSYFTKKESRKRSLSLYKCNHLHLQLNKYHNFLYEIIQVEAGNWHTKQNMRKRERMVSISCDEWLILKLLKDLLLQFLSSINLHNHPGYLYTGFNKSFLSICYNIMHSPFDWIVLSLLMVLIFSILSHHQRCLCRVDSVASRLVHSNRDIIFPILIYSSAHHYCCAVDI
jgi:hypothetical protein